MGHWILFATTALSAIMLVIIGWLLRKHLKNKKPEQKTYYSRNTGLVSEEVFRGLLDYMFDLPKEKGKIVVLSCDLSELYNLGQLYGEETKNLLIKETVTRIKSTLRSNDYISDRGKSCLMVLLSRVTNQKDVEMVAQRLLTSFEEPFYLEGREFKLHTSIGIALHPDNSRYSDILIKNAESAMVKAKTVGVNSYSFYEEDNDTPRKKNDIVVRDLKLALQTNQFILYYQPQLSLEENKVVGVEALVRWMHPEKGLVSPAEFIPVAEASGLIVQMGYWILRTACKQHKEWGIPDLVVSVNLSAHQFQQRDLIPRIEQILYEEGMNPENLNIEITESTSMSNTKFSLKVLKELRDMGIEISIDDFGTGHSSLAYLTQFPITALKIDKSFVDDITRSKDGESLVRTIIKLAKDLSLSVVAEGVETEAQLQFLKELKCDDIQGYLFSPPVPADRILEVVTQGHVA
jgi:polar amino acid transport system substrate-binding protein